MGDVGTALFCFTFVTNDRGKGQTQDFEILSVAQKHHIFIFACDHWVVFSDVDKALSPGRTVNVGFPKVVKRPNTKVWTNLLLFLNIWKNIKQEGTWKGYAWTVKADPYTPFHAPRTQCLRSRTRVAKSGSLIAKRCGRPGYISSPKPKSIRSVSRICSLRGK